jgi:rod shape-determining protein MreC
VAVYRRAARPRFTLFLLILTSVTVITLDYRGDAGGVIDSIKGTAQDAFAPVQDAADAAFRPVGDFFQGITHYGALEKENARLRDQLEEARGQTLRAADAEREREQLLELDNLTVVQNIPSVAARVVSTSTSNFDLTIQIDKGKDAGVALRMPVVTGAGLVGRVTSVSRTRSTILLITDPSSSVGIRLTGSGEVGVANGRGSDKDLSVDFVAPDAEVAKGEVVVSSGLQQSEFPPSIPIGKVTEASSPNGAFQKFVRVKPIVDLHRLSFVKVLQWSPS